MSAPVDSSTAAPAAPRRPLRSRSSSWATGAAHALARTGVRPNTISLLSIVAAVAGGGALLALRWVEAGGAQAALLVAATLCIQLRLVCNLLDGLVAIEGGLASPTGGAFNEFPDRIADVVLLVGAGAAVTQVAWGIQLGWAAAVGALATAYVRLLAGSLGAPQRFTGPMAKQHRMALLTFACLASLVELAVAGDVGRVLGVALAVVVVGTAATMALRLRQLLRDLAPA